jgi:tryptophan-rich sensory protein
VKTYIATAAAVTAAAAVGGLATGRPAQNDWYRALRKPPFQPPPVAFPVVWTALYAAIAGASATTIDNLHARGADDAARDFELALGANLALNAGWTWLFFRARRPVLATVESAVLTASTADLARRARHASSKAHAALAPYLVWTAFATVLSGSIAWLNRAQHR